MPKVIDNPDASRYEVYDGDEFAGFARYKLNGDQISFMHTELDPAFEGRGLGSALAREALDDARTRGRTVLPYCPFIQGWIGKHPDYLDLVPEDKRAEFEL